MEALQFCSLRSPTTRIVENRNDSSDLAKSGEYQTSLHLAIEPVDDDSVSGGSDVQLLEA